MEGRRMGGKGPGVLKGDGRDGAWRARKDRN